MKTEQNIYVVVGTTGEYADTHVWNARAFIEEEDAKQFAHFLNSILNEMRVSPSSITNSTKRWLEVRDRATTKMQEYDVGFSLDYTGTSYSAEAVPFVTTRSGAY